MFLFHDELVLCNDIPYLVKNSDLYATEDWNQLIQATLLVNQYISLQDKYKNVATEKLEATICISIFIWKKTFTINVEISLLQLYSNWI